MARYAIIDSTHRPHFHERLETFQVPYMSLFEGHAESRLIDIAPLLMKCDEAVMVDGMGVLRHVIKLAQERPAVSFVESALDLEELARHLRAFHLVKLPGRKEMVMRWYDTRILPVWMDILTEAQRAGFLVGIDCWTYFDRFGQEQVLSLPQDRPAFAELPPIVLDQAQYEALNASCEADVLIAHLRRVTPDELRGIDYARLYPFVLEHLSASRNHGLRSIDEHVQYLLLALYTSGGFHAHPEVAQRLVRPADQHEQNFVDWALALPEDVWDTGRPLWEVGTVDVEARVERSTSRT